MEINSKLWLALFWNPWSMILLEFPLRILSFFIIKPQSSIQLSKIFVLLPINYGNLEQHLVSSLIFLLGCLNYQFLNFELPLSVFDDGKLIVFFKNFSFRWVRIMQICGIWFANHSISREGHLYDWCKWSHFNDRYEGVDFVLLSRMLSLGRFFLLFLFDMRWFLTRVLFWVTNFIVTIATRRND